MTLRTLSWIPWDSPGFEHARIRNAADAVVVDSVVAGQSDGAAFGLTYRLELDPKWCLRRAEIGPVGQTPLVRTADGAGGWLDGNGEALPALAGAVDIDIQVTPLTNSLPIRRLALPVGESAEILTLYVTVPEYAVGTDRQRYTRISAHRYLYEGLESGFTAEIEVDAHGAVTAYPGLFRRVSE